MLINLLLFGLALYLLYSHRKLEKDLHTLQINQRRLLEILNDLRGHNSAQAPPPDPKPWPEDDAEPVLQAAAAAEPEPRAQRTEPSLGSGTWAQGVGQRPPAPRTPAFNGVQRRSAPPVQNREKNLENWVGRNLIGVAAAVLVFIGLVFFSLLVYNRIGDLIKIILMYVFSAALTGLGIWLTRRKTNIFTQTLTGCGCGAFFISVLVTHIVFGRLPFQGAFALLLLWTVLTLYISKLTRSFIIAVIAHLGMLLSVCFAYTYGFSSDKLAYLVVYQLAAALLVPVGNLLFSKRTYLLGLFSALILSLFATASMLRYFTPAFFSGSGALSVSSSSAIGVFLLQLLTASAFSLLISAALRDKPEGFGRAVLDLSQDMVRAVLHASGKLIWLCVLILVTDRALTGCFLTFMGKSVAIAAAACAGLLVLLLHMELSLVLGRKQALEGRHTHISVIICSLGITKYLLDIWFSNLSGGIPPVPLLAALALLLLSMDKRGVNGAYRIAAHVALGLDLLLMLNGGYERLSGFGTIAASLVYMLIYPAFLAMSWRYADSSRREHLLPPYLITAYVLLHLSVNVIVSPAKDAALISAVSLTVLNAVLLGLDAAAPIRKGLETARRFFSIAVQVLLIVDLGVIVRYSWNGIDTTSRLLLISSLSVLSISLCAVKLYLSVRQESEARFPLALTGSITLTLLILAFIHATTSLFDQAYTLSLVCMVIALCFVTAGFLGKVKVFRLYGLTIVLICVLKLVTFDVASLNTIFRVSALIGGGVICFVISGIYNYSVKQLDASGESGDSNEAE